MQPSVANTESSLDPISISNMTEHDLLEVVEIEEQSRLSRWGWAAYYAELQGINRSLMLVARTNSKVEGLQRNRVAGYIVARFSAGELHINNVAVRSEFVSSTTASSRSVRNFRTSARLWSSGSRDRGS